MDEAEALADRIAVLKDGEIVAEGTPSTVGGSDRAPYQITFTLPEGLAIGELPTEAGAPSALDETGKLTIESEHVMPTLRALSAWRSSTGTTSRTSWCADQRLRTSTSD